MSGMYDRNRLYITPGNQAKIKKCKIVLAGAGLGSVIAECALRLGFEDICIIDGDKVDFTNLNRQNYICKDLGSPKVVALSERLKSINFNAQIRSRNIFLDEYNIRPMIHGFDIAINAIDFNSEAPFLFDDVCINQGIPVLHPYNLGWAGCVFVVTDSSKQLNSIQAHSAGFEVEFVKFVISRLKKQQINVGWLENIVNKFINEEEKQSPPQLSVASWITAGLCVNIMYNLATGEKVKTFPDFYYMSCT